MLRKLAAEGRSIGLIAAKLNKSKSSVQRRAEILRIALSKISPKLRYL